MKASGWLHNAVTVTQVIFFIVERGIARFLCTMHVFDIRSSSLPPSLPLCQIVFLSQPPLLARGEKAHTVNVCVPFISRAKQNCEIKGREYQLQAKIGQNYNSISNCVVLIRQNNFACKVANF